jgi:hypothetical protein
MPEGQMRIGEKEILKIFLPKFGTLKLKNIYLRPV